MKKILLALGLMGALLIATPSASATHNHRGTYDGWYISGCSDPSTNGATPKMQQIWPGDQTRIYVDPFIESRGHAEFYEWVNVYYWWCPGGTAPNKSKVYAYKFCDEWVSGDRMQDSSGHNVDGFKYNPYFATESGTTVVNPGQSEHATNYHNATMGVSYCDDKKTIGSPAWMLMSADPYYSLYGSVDQAHASDTGFQFWNMPDDPHTHFHLTPDADDSLLNP